MKSLFCHIALLFVTMSDSTVGRVYELTRLLAIPFTFFIQIH